MSIIIPLLKTFSLHILYLIKKWNASQIFLWAFSFFVSSRTWVGVFEKLFLFVLVLIVRFCLRLVVLFKADFVYRVFFEYPAARAVAHLHAYLHF